MNRILSIILMYTCFFSLMGEESAVFKFCVTGDSRGLNGKNGGVNEKVLTRLAMELNKERPRFVLFTGDLVKGNTTPEKLKKQLSHWRKMFMQPLLDKNIGVYVCRGNHDLVASHKSKESKFKISHSVWNQVFTGKFQMPMNGPETEKNLTYRIDNDNATVFCFDTYNPEHEKKVDIPWFKKELRKLAQNKYKGHLFLFAHEPAYAVRHQDCLDDHPDSRDEIVNIFSDAGGVAMFFGHDHRYNHAKAQLKNGVVHQFVVGTAGAPRRSWNFIYSDNKVRGVADSRAYGYLLVEIDGAKAKLTMKGWEKDGQIRVLDTFEYKLKKEKGK